MNQERPHPDVSRWLAELAERDVPRELDLWPRIVRRLEWSRAGSALRRELPPGSFERLTAAATSADPRHARSRRRQVLELVAGVVVFATVAALLLVMFRGWGGSSDELPGAQPTSTLVRQELLYVVSHAGYPNPGLITALDVTTGETVFSIDTGSQVDAVASPDGRTLYAASVDPELWVDELTAYDVARNEVLWTVPLQYRIHHMFGVGPSTLAVSADGSQIYVYSAESQGEYFVRIMDAATGSDVGRIDGVSGCAARLYPSGDSRTLYVVCLGVGQGSTVQMLDLVSRRPGGSVLVGGTLVGAVASPDDKLLYILSEEDGLNAITAIDMNARSKASYRQVAHLGEHPLHSLQIFTLSPDGSRLFYGLGFEPPDSPPYANEVWTVVPLRQGEFVWSYDQKFLAGLRQITGPTLVIAPDGQSFFAVHNAYAEDSQKPMEALIRDIGAGFAETFASLSGQEVLQMFSGWRWVPATEIEVPNSTATP